MQRAAAASPNQSTASSSRSPASAPPSQRRRIDIQPQSYTPSPSVRTPNQFSSTPDLKNDQNAPIRGRGSRQGDETEWCLKIDLPQAEPRVPQVNGHREDEVEDEEDEIWANQAVGRQTYGSFKRKKAQTDTTTAVKESDELSFASDSDDSSSSPASSKALRYHQARDANRARPVQGPTRSAQAPKRFFDQVSLDGPRSKDMTPEKQRKKQQHHQRKKPRITI